MRKKGGIFNVNKKKAPKAEVYGFILWLSSIILFIIYILWSIIPDKILEQFHITYYPDKYWTIALPIYFLVLFIVFYSFMIFYQHWKTLPLDSIYTIKDEFSLPLEEDSKDKFLPKYSDISIEEVNKILYLK